MTEIRTITEAEKEEYLRVGQYGFGRYTDDPVDQFMIASTPLRGPLAAFVDGKMVSRLNLHAFEQSVRGVVKKMGGISGVATYPEFRGKGLVRALMTRSFETMRDGGMCVSMLYPFKESFYEGFGYVRTAAQMTYHFPVSSLGEYLGSGSGSRLTLRTMRALDAREIYFDVLKESFSGIHGRILFEDLDEAAWMKRFKDRLFLLVTRDGKTTAMARIAKDGYMVSGRLTVEDLLFTDRESFRVILGFLASHRDQVSTVSMIVPAGTNIASMLPRLGWPVEVTMKAAPWMVRIIDIPGAFEGIPARTKGSCVIEVSDRRCPWNDGVYELSCDGKRLSAVRTERKPQMATVVDALTAMLYGSFPVRQVIDEFSPDITDPDVTALLESWFPAEILFNDYHF